MQRCIIFSRKFTEILADERWLNTYCLHIRSCIDGSRLHLAQSNNVLTHHKRYRLIAAVIDSKEGVQVSSHIRGVKSTENGFRNVYADMHWQLTATVFFISKTALLVARVGPKPTYNIATRESYQHHKCEEQYQKSFTHLFVHSPLAPAYILQLAEDNVVAIISSCI